MTAVDHSGSKIGIIAGNGMYPHLLADSLQEENYKVYVAALKGRTVRVIDFNCADCAVFPVGALGRCAQYFRDNGVGTVYMAGGVSWKKLWKYFRPDFLGYSLLPKVLFRGDDSLLVKVATALGTHGIKIENPAPFIQELFVDVGHWAGPAPTSKIRESLNAAWQGAKNIGRKDKGQGAIAIGTRVIAKEGRAGTDTMIRSVAYPGGCLVKVVKPGQDRRFDLPAIGPATVLCAKQNGLCAIGIEAGGVLLLEKEKIKQLCNENNITLVASKSGTF